MSPHDFFTAILPSTGHYVVWSTDGTRHLTHVAHDAESLIDRVMQLDDAGRSVYYAPLSFNELRPKGMRKADNAALARCFFMDLDVGVGDEKYANRKEAVESLATLVKANNLPKPIIVSSGNGFHVYWPMTEDIPVDEWEPVALALERAAIQLGVKFDDSKIHDRTTVLRPPGSHWRKEGEREVRVVQAATPTPFADFKAKLASKIQPLELFGLNDDLTARPDYEYAPSSAHQIAERCQTLAHMRDTKGADITEPLWYDLLGVIKHTVEADQVAHDWSNGHPGYNEDETERKLAQQRTYGPTTCAKIRQQYGSKCDGCTQTCKSPIQLGVSADVIQEIGAAAKSLPPTEIKTIESLQVLPKGFAFYQGKLCRQVKDADGNAEWVSFSDSLIYPVTRLGHEDGKWEIELEHHAYGQHRATFRVATETTYDPKTLAKELAGYEVQTWGDKGRFWMTELVKIYVAKLMENNIAKPVISHMGWGADFGHFAIGNHAVYSDGRREIDLSPELDSSGYNVDYGVSGSAEGWANKMDQLYNRDGAEIAQFLMLVSFGSPLIRLLDSDTFKGLSIALTGKSGVGKTTLARLACSAWGRGRYMVKRADVQGATMKAIERQISISSDLPIVLDELTNREPGEIAELMFGASSGESRKRCRVSGQIETPSREWRLFLVATSNADLTELLSVQQERAAEATQMRLLDIKVPDNFGELFADINAKTIIEEELEPVEYGCAGQKFMQYVMQNRELVTNMLGHFRRQCIAMRNETNTADFFLQQERFYLDALAVTLTAGTIAKHLGLVKFDLAKVRDWYKNQIVSGRMYRNSITDTLEDRLHAFVASWHPYTLETQDKFSPGNGFRGAKCVGAVTMPLKELQVRISHGDKCVMVSKGYFKTWCAERNINPFSFFHELVAKGYVVAELGRDAPVLGRTVALGRGTSVASPNSRCYAFSYETIFPWFKETLQDDARVTVEVSPQVSPSKVTKLRK